MKTFDQTTLDVIESGVIRTCHLLEINFDTPIYFCDAGFQIVDDGKTYIPEELTGIDEFSRNAQLEIAEMAINFSMLSGAIPALGLGQNFLGRKVTIQHAILNDNNEIVRKDIRWRGMTKRYSDNESIASFDVVNYFGGNSSVNPWRTTPNSHKKRHPNDECFKFAKDADKIILWGGKYSGGKRATGDVQKRITSDRAG